MKACYFLPNDTVVDKGASDIDVSVLNADELGSHLEIQALFVTDDIRKDSLISPNEIMISSDGASEKYSWEWFDIQKTAEGKLKIHVDENEGGERSLSINVASFANGSHYAGTFCLTQEGTK